MWNASPAKAAAYWKALRIGLLLTGTQLFILFFVVASRTLGADTMHSANDALTLFGTAYILGRSWTSETVFLKWRRRWLLVGVWSLALGGLFVAGEALHDILEGAGGAIRSWPLLFAAILGAAGNWRMHQILDTVAHEERDALDHNNLDHVFWDMILSLAVLAAYLSGAPLVDRLIAIVVGLFVLPYLAWKRWKEDGDGYGNHEHEHNNEHHDHKHHH
ncbi:MAG: cation transporter [bacterium]|nr:cation transporter [bacterium]